MSSGVRDPAEYGSLSPMEGEGRLQSSSNEQGPVTTWWGRLGGWLHTYFVSWPARVSFLLTFTLVTMPVWAYCLVTDLCCCCTWSQEALRRRGSFAGWLVWLAWRLAFRVCFWIRTELRSGVRELERRRGHRSIFLACNHVTWLDTPLICANLPEHLVPTSKTLMARSHLSLPVLGRLASVVGHMPIPFSSKRRGDFSVDREGLAKTMERVNAHVASGGHLVVFPEGDLNPHWRTLLPFRAGGVELCVKHDMEVWGWVCAGAADSWPSGAVLGGSPATIHIDAVLLYPSAKEAAAALVGADADVRSQALALADNMRLRMQQALDELASGTAEHVDAAASEKAHLT